MRPPSQPFRAPAELGRVFWIPGAAEPASSRAQERLAAEIAIARRTQALAVADRRASRRARPSLAAARRLWAAFGRAVLVARGRP